MREFVDRHRHLSLLVAVLVGQLLFLAYQIKTENEVRLIRVWAYAALSPIVQSMHWTSQTAERLLEDYILLHRAQQENRRLQAELERARVRLQALEARAAEADKLAAMLAFSESQGPAAFQAAAVIAASPASRSRVVVINRGRGHGLRENMVVLTPEGVVGKLVAVFSATAQVLLLTDEKSGVGARVEGTDIVGVVKGTGGPLCRLEYVPNELPVPVGAMVETSGQDQLFPKGLRVGRVTGVQPGEFFQEIQVEPTAPLTYLENVLVLKEASATLGTTARQDRTAEDLRR